MRKAIQQVLFIALTVALSSTLASAGTVTLNDWTTGNFANNAPDGGGAFQATTVGGPLGNGASLTFCLEITEHFSYDDAYDYELSDAAKAGGGGAVGIEDPLDKRSKYLYQQAVTGAYTSWDPSLIGFDWTNSGWYIQEAIWLIEQERDLSQVHPRNLAMFANTQANLMNLTEVVRVMNITAVDGTPQQDQLVVVRVPDEGRSIQVLVIAILGMMAFDRFVGRRLARRLNF